MLPYFEAYRRYDLPEKLKTELFNSEGKSLLTLDNLKKINIFVGPNNCGKSLLLREITKTSSKTYYGDDQWEKIENLILLYQEIPNQIRSVSSIPNLISLRDNHEGQIIDLSAIENFYAEISKYKADYSISVVVSHLGGIFDRNFSFRSDRIYYFANQTNGNQHGIDGPNRAEILTNIFACINELKEKATGVIASLLSIELPSNPQKEQRIYIPSIRSLRELANNTQIESAIRKEYNFESEIRIYTGQDFPQAIANHKNNAYELRRKITKYESFLSESFFRSQKIELTYHTNDRMLYIKIGNEKDRPIHDLGDGLQMIVILTFPFFMYSGGTISIEEPELFVHAGLQKEFIKFLDTHENARNFQIFITTHSNHILDSVNTSNDISIFSVNKRPKARQNKLNDEEEPDFIVENIAYGNENILRLLGVTSTSVYLSNCVIWVEGITDKIYFQRFIEVYLERQDLKDKYKIIKSFKEGINYSFSLTGGDSIVHFDFDETSEYTSFESKIIVNKFCSKSFLIVDNDFGRKAERKKMFEKTLGKRFIVLDVPEVENLLPTTIIDFAVLEYPTVKKALEGKGLQTMSQDIMKNHKIGHLIDNVLLQDYPKRKKFSAENGGLKPSDKYEFCIHSIAFVNATNIPFGTNIIIEQILDFILDMNPGYDIA